MEIKINQSVFELNKFSKVETEQFQISITEPGFNEEDADIRKQFKATPIFFPEFIERLIKRTTYSRIYRKTHKAHHLPPPNHNLPRQ